MAIPSMWAVLVYAPAYAFYESGELPQEPPSCGGITAAYLVPNCSHSYHPPLTEVVMKPVMRPVMTATKEKPLRIYSLLPQSLIRRI